MAPSPPPLFSATIFERPLYKFFPPPLSPPTKARPTKQPPKPPPRHKPILTILPPLFSPSFLFCFLFPFCFFLHQSQTKNKKGGERFWFFSSLHSASQPEAQRRRRKELIPWEINNTQRKKEKPAAPYEEEEEEEAPFRNLISANSPPLAAGKKKGPDFVEGTKKVKFEMSAPSYNADKVVQWQWQHVAIILCASIPTQKNFKLYAIREFIFCQRAATPRTF